MGCFARNQANQWTILPRPPRRVRRKKRQGDGHSFRSRSHDQTNSGLRSGHKTSGCWRKYSCSEAPSPDQHVKAAGGDRRFQSLQELDVNLRKGRVSSRSYPHVLQHTDTILCIIKAERFSWIRIRNSFREVFLPRPNWVRAPRLRKFRSQNIASA